MLHIAVSEQLDVSSTTTDHCRACEQTILLACQLKIVGVLFTLQLIE